MISDDVAAAVDAIHAGQLVGMPTETVYGLAANACDAAAVLQVFAAKQRPHFDPLIVHVADADMANAYAQVSQQAQQLMRAFWPGPLTLVLPKTARVPDEVTSGLDTVAIRCPDHPMALALIRGAGLGIAAPSANLFGRISPTTAAHVAAQLGDKVALILDGGACRIGVESSVLALFDETKPAQLLRPGGLSAEDLSQVLGYVPEQVQLAEVEREHLALSAPGQLKSHYAPQMPMQLKQRSEPWIEDGDAAYLTWSQPISFACRASVCLSPAASVDEAASRLFAAMRELEASGAKCLYAEYVPEHGLGAAVNDRLRRAASLA